MPYLHIGPIDPLAFLTAITAGACLVPPFLALFDAPHMFALSPQKYLEEQRAQEGLLVFFRVSNTMAFSLSVACAFIFRGSLTAFPFSVAGCISLAVAGLVSFIVDRQAAAATVRWTHVPVNFKAIRHRWEYAQVAAAVFTVGGFITVLFSIAARDF